MGVVVRAPDAPGKQAVTGVLRDDPGRRALGRARDGLHLGDAVVAEVVELLDLVEAALLLLDVLHRPDPSGEVVDEGDVGDRPRAGLEGRREGLGEQGAVSLSESAARVTSHELFVGEPHQHLAGVDLRPPCLHEGLDLEVVLPLVEEVGARVALTRHPDVGPCRLTESNLRGLGGPVALVLAQHPGPHLVEGAAVEPDRLPRDERAKLLGGVGHGVVGRP